MNESYRHAMYMLDANYPQLASWYSRMMRSARIITPPKLEVLPLPHIGLADYMNDAIYLDEGLVNMGREGRTKAVIGHETGHLLTDRRMHADTAPKDWRTNEQEADRIAVYLTGSHEDVSAMRKAANESVRLGRQFGQASRRRRSGLMPDAQPCSEKAWQDYVAQYGTPEELEANIRGVDLTDRRHVDALIEKRNARTELTRD